MRDGRNLVFREQGLEFFEVREFGELSVQLNDHPLRVGVQVYAVCMISAANGKRMIIAALKHMHIRRSVGGRSYNRARSSSSLGLPLGLLLGLGLNAGSVLGGSSRLALGHVSSIVS